MVGQPLGFLTRPYIKIIFHILSDLFNTWPPTPWSTLPYFLTFFRGSILEGSAVPVCFLKSKFNLYKTENHVGISLATLLTRFTEYMALYIF